MEQKTLEKVSKSWPSNLSGAIERSYDFTIETSLYPLQWLIYVFNSVVNTELPVVTIGSGKSYTIF